MGYQVIARKYRPRSFEGVVGQEAIARTLRNAIAQGRVAHAYMFCGPRGVGKTSMARLLARALDCLSTPGPSTDPCGTCDLCVRASVGEDLDVLEIDAASNRRVEDARTLIANVSFHPSRARFKVYIVDEVHMLTTEAFNSLLKTLEEPPPHVKFIFATTDPQKVPATILSRCQRFDFRPVPSADIAALLARICEDEGLKAQEEALQAIARASLGGVRDAESLLEQLATMGSGEVRLDDLHALLGTVPGERMRRLFDALSQGDAAAALAQAAEVLDGGTDPAELLRQCMRHAHDLMLVRAQGAKAADVVADQDARRALAEQAQRFSEATLVYAVTLFSEALKNLRLLGEGRLFAETALARLAGHRDLRYLDQMVRELQALERRLASGLPAPPSLAPLAPLAPTLPPPASATSQAPVVDAPVATPAPPPSPAPAAELPAADEPAAAPSAAASSSAASSLPGDLRARWPEVLLALRGSSRLVTSLQPAQVEEIRDDAVVLSFPAGETFHRSVVQEPEMRQRLEDAFAQVGGVRRRLETVERAAPAEQQQAEERAAPPVRERLTAAETDAARHAPLTKLVERELGARIVHLERQE